MQPLKIKTLEQHFSKGEIIEKLCKIRVKIAKSRNKKQLIHQLTSLNSFNHHTKEKALLKSTTSDLKNDFSKYQKDLLIQLNEILPPRRKWVKIGQKLRVNASTKNPISSSDKNILSLRKTISKYESEGSSEIWLVKLNQFIENIQYSVSHNSVSISKPIVIPKLKEDKINSLTSGEKNVCRPLCLYSLQDRILLSLTNRFLTVIFDNYFLKSSYAFRSIKNKERTSTLTHHDCIDEILDIRREARSKPLWVVECDMEKFFDSVNHSIIRKLFNDIIKNVTLDFPSIHIKTASSIFYEYLASYSFNRDVPKASNTKYWKSYSIPNGEFTWVGEKLIKLGYYKNINIPRIGIPQGGALSGLIANIVLNEADKKMELSNTKYLRFCDDMLIISKLKKDAIKAKSIYVESLNSLKLVPHNFPSSTNYYKNIISTNNISELWKGKSKGPYKWGSPQENGFAWIGFVGYEIDYLLNIRVRKKSLHKEINKQKITVDKIYEAIKTGCRRKSGYITESAINRLVGMAVGRVTLRNYQTIDNELCWKNGFKKLSPNKFVIQQVKLLDRNRNKLYYDLEKFLRKENIHFEDEEIVDTKNRQVINYDKPFSYYHQIIERKLDS